MLRLQVGGSVRVVVSNRLYTGTVPGSYIRRCAATCLAWHSSVSVLLSIYAAELARGMAKLVSRVLQCIRQCGVGAMAGARLQQDWHHAPEHRLQTLRSEVCPRDGVCSD